MSESFNITFQGGTETSNLINDIRGKFEDLDNQVYEDEMERLVPEISISSFGAEQAVENFLIDVLEEVQTQATSNESDFNQHI